MNALDIPEFNAYEEEAGYWDNLDTAPFMEDDGEWFQFECPLPSHGLQLLSDHPA